MPKMNDKSGSLFDFKSEVNDAYDTFPQLKKKTIFYDVAHKKIYSHNPLLKIAGKLLLRGEGAEGNETMPVAGNGLAMIFDQSDSLFQIGNGAFLFDHELGHMLTPNLWEMTENRRECIADAFSIIRHFQRFGIEGDDARNLAIFRGLESIFNSGVTGHLSLPVIAKIWADRHTIDFAALSPEETFQKAIEYVDKYSPNGGDLKLVKDKFDPRSLVSEDQRPKKIGDSYKVDMLDLLELTAKTCLTTNNPTVFLVGTTLVISEVSNDPGWAKVIDKMQAHAQKLGINELMKIFKQNADEVTLEETPRMNVDITKRQSAVITRLLKL